MQLPVSLRRRGYRLAFRILRVYWYFRRPTVHGVKCVLTNGHQVLLVRHTYGPRSWELPGGAVKRNEPPAVAARREMEEELGVRIDNLSLIGELWATIYHCKDTLHLFHAELSAPELKLDLGELEAADWFPRARLPHDIGVFVPAVLSKVAEGRRSA